LNWSPPSPPLFFSLLPNLSRGSKLLIVKDSLFFFGFFCDGSVLWCYWSTVFFVFAERSADFEPPSFGRPFLFPFFVVLASTVPSKILPHHPSTREHTPVPKSPQKGRRGRNQKETTREGATRGGVSLFFFHVFSHTFGPTPHSHPQTAISHIPRPPKKQNKKKHNTEKLRAILFFFLLFHFRSTEHKRETAGLLITLLAVLFRRLMPHECDVKASSRTICHDIFVCIHSLKCIRS